MTATFELTATMKIDDCQKLHQFLHDAREQAVTLDCKDVSRVSGLAAQIMLMAQKHWAATGHGFVLANPTDDFINGIKDLGLAEMLLPEAAA